MPIRGVAIKRGKRDVGAHLTSTNTSLLASNLESIVRQAALSHSSLSLAPIDLLSGVAKSADRPADGSSGSLRELPSREARRPGAVGGAQVARRSADVLWQHEQALRGARNLPPMRGTASAVVTNERQAHQMIPSKELLLPCERMGWRYEVIPYVTTQLWPTLWRHVLRQERRGKICGEEPDEVARPPCWSLPPLYTRRIRR